LFFLCLLVAVPKSFFGLHMPHVPSVPLVLVWVVCYLRQECFVAALACVRTHFVVLGLVLVSVIGMGIGTGMNPDTVCRSVIENARFVVRWRLYLPSSTCTCFFLHMDSGLARDVLFIVCA
jgi:hypothetical protein